MAAEPPPAAQPAHPSLIDYLTPAAQRGDPQAQYELGALSKDPAVAFDWFRKAAEQGHADAQYKLAYAYLLGECAQVGCVWSLRPGEQRPQLAMERKKS